MLAIWLLLHLAGCEGIGSLSGAVDAGDAADLSGSQGFATLTGALSAHGIALQSTDRAVIPLGLAQAGVEAAFRVHRVGGDSLACALDGASLAITSPPEGEVDWTLSLPGLGRGMHDLRCTVTQPSGARQSASWRLFVTGPCAAAPDCADGHPCTEEECTGGTCSYRERDNCCAQALGCAEDATCTGLGSGASACVSTSAAACGDGLNCSPETWDLSGAAGPWGVCLSDPSTCAVAPLAGCQRFESGLSGWTEQPPQGLWEHVATPAGQSSAGALRYANSSPIPGVSCLVSPPLAVAPGEQLWLQFWRGQGAGAIAAPAGTATLRWFGAGQDPGAAQVLWANDATVTAWDRQDAGLELGLLPPGEATQIQLAWCVQGTAAGAEWRFDDLCASLGTPPELNCGPVISQFADAKPTDRVHGVWARAGSGQGRGRPLAWRTLDGPAFLQWYPGLYNGHDDRWYGSLDLRSASAAVRGAHTARFEVSDGVLAADCTATVDVGHKTDVLLWTKALPRDHWQGLKDLAIASGRSVMDTPELAHVGHLGDYRAVIAVLGNGEHAQVPTEAEAARLQGYFAAGGALAVQTGGLASGGSGATAALIAQLGVASAQAGALWEPSGTPLKGYWLHPANMQSGTPPWYALFGVAAVNASIDRLRPTGQARGTLGIDIGQSNPLVYAQVALTDPGQRGLVQSAGFAGLAAGDGSANTHRVLQYLLREGPSCAVHAECEDGLECTLDQCIQLACSFDIALGCDDANACTADACTPAGQCQHLFTAAPCTDGQICTGGDQCVQGVCQAGSPVDCGDNNPCTSESCQEGPGCVYLPTAATCDDLNPCTQDDSCAGGACVLANPAPAPLPYCGTAAVLAPPTDPVLLAPPLAQDVPTAFAEQIAFLYQGPNAIQQGMVQAPPAQRLAVIRGRVLQWLPSGGSFPLHGAVVRAVGVGEVWGYAVSRTDGWFDLVVAGGMPVTIDIRKPGFLPAQRQVDAPLLDFAVAGEIVLSQPDSKVTQVETNGAFALAQHATGTMVNLGSASTLTDEQPRQTMLVFPPNVKAWRVNGGAMTPADNLQVRLTEYTGGGKGPDAMPADLPPATAWNYCAEFSDDEALAKGMSVQFDRPISGYVDNLLGLQVGDTVPIGWYDRNEGVWKRLGDTAGKPGFERYVKVAWVVGAKVVAGNVELYLTSDNSAVPLPQLASPAVAEAWGFSAAELGEVAKWLIGRYGVAGAAEMHTFWRFQIDHMTPYDVNLSFIYEMNPPMTPRALVDRGVGRGPDCRETLMDGSIIGCDTRSLREVVPVAGTGLALVYDSQRTPGGASTTLDFETIASTGVSSTAHTTVDHAIVGRGAVTSENAQPDNLPQVTALSWNGRDAYGRPLVGYSPVAAMTSHGKTNPQLLGRALWVGPFPEISAIPGALTSDGACNGPSTSIGDFSLKQYPDGGVCAVYRSYDQSVSWLQVPPQTFGAAQLRSAQLSLPSTNFSYHASRARTYSSIRRTAFLGRQPAPADLGGWLVSAHHVYDVNTRTVALGTGQIQSAQASRETLGTVAGGGTIQPSSLPLTATAVNLDDGTGIQDVAATADGRKWIATGKELLVVNADGQLDRHCNTASFDGRTLRGLAVSRTGSLLVSASNVGVADGRLYEVSADHGGGPAGGLCPVRVLAGGGQNGLKSFGQATAQQFEGGDVAAARDGAIYLAIQGRRQVWRIDPGGTMAPFAGNGAAAGDCMSPQKVALESCIGDVQSLAVDRFGTVYIGNAVGNLYRVHFSGLIAQYDLATADGKPTEPTYAGHAVTGLAVRGDSGLVWCQESTGQQGASVSVWTADLSADATDLVGMQRIVGTGTGPSPSDAAQTATLAGGPAGDLGLAGCRSLAPTSDGRWLVAAKVYRENQVAETRVLLAGPKEPAYTPSGWTVPSADGSEIWEFDLKGRHKRTLDALTGQVLFEFGYLNQRLSTITQPHGQVTRIHRTAEGVAYAIEAPGGQWTALAIDGSGLLKQVQDPGGGKVKLAYASGAGQEGLLTAIEQPDGSQSKFTWDDTGRLNVDFGPAGNLTALMSGFDFNSGVRTSVAMSKLGRQTVSTWRGPSPAATGTAHEAIDPAGRIAADYDFAAATVCTDVMCPRMPQTALATNRAAHSVHVSADGSTNWTRYVHENPWYAAVSRPAESWTEVSPNLTVHSRTDVVGDYATGTVLPSALTSTTHVDGVSPQESSAPWRTEFQPEAAGGYRIVWTSPMGRVHWQRFNVEHQVVESGGLGLAKATYGYNTTTGLPEHVTVTSADGATPKRSSEMLWSPARNLVGQRAETTDAMILYGHDAVGRVTQQQFADGATAYTPRDLAGQVTAVVPATTSSVAGIPFQGPPAYVFHYGPGGRLDDEQLPQAAPWLFWSTPYVYDLDRSVVEIRRPDGGKFVFSRGASDGLLKTLTAPDDAQDGAVKWETKYEPTGARRLTELTHGSNTLTYGYSGALPVSEGWTGAGMGGTHGASVSRQWDARLRVSAQSVHTPYSGGGASETKLNFAYDFDDLPVAVTLTTSTGTALADLQLQRDAATGRLMALTVTANPGNPATAKSLRVDYAYNGFGELSSQQVAGPQGPLYREGYPERDQLGRLTKRVVGTDPATAVTHGYVYHPQRGWLTQHKLNDSLADAWSYDVRGNRVGKHTGLAGEVTATVDAQDRLVQLGGEALAYDLNGRVIARSGGQPPATYVWDAFGRLREARLNPSQPTEIAVAYGLDPAGRRVRAVAKDASGAVLDDRSWVYDGQLRVIAEVSASGALRARYLYASSGHSPDLAVRFDPDSGVVTGSYLLVHDQVGSVVRTVDLATGVAVEVVAYDPWGVATVAPGGTALHPFGFAGGLWDRRTGLVRFGAREYDAGLGRWLARDPIGFGGGWNQYGYVAGNPVDFADPSGLANYEHPMQWLPPDADIRAGALLAEQEIAESLRDGLVGAMLWEIGGALWDKALWKGGVCGGGICFVAGTQIATKDGPKPIEEVEKGDLVLSRNEETGEIDYRPVAGTSVTHDKLVIDVHTVDDEGDANTIGVTPEHPFWVVEKGWAQAGDLLPGDALFTSRGGWLRVTGLTWRPESATVYNFEVADFHTYFAGEGEAWVHNTCDPTKLARDVLPGRLRREFPGEYLDKSLNQIKEALKGATGKEKNALQKAKKLLEQITRLMDK